MKIIFTLTFLSIFPLCASSYYNCTSEVLTFNHINSAKQEFSVTKVFSFNLLFDRSVKPMKIKGYFVERQISNTYGKGTDCNETVVSKDVWDGACYPQISFVEFETEEVTIDDTEYIRYKGKGFFEGMYFDKLKGAVETFDAKFYLNEYDKPFTMYCSHGDIG